MTTAVERIGPFLVRGELGRGGMGIVYEAEHEGTRRVVALKVLPGAFALDRESIERFRREAQAAARISHPAIVPVFEVGFVGGLHFTVMKRMTGPSLHRRIEEEPRAGWRRIAEAIGEVAEALDLAHRQGIVHRDIKPSNLLFREDGGLALGDFGLAKLEGSAKLTASGAILGTPQYMSPEQAQGLAVDARTDVYSLGVTLWEALAGKWAFAAENVEAVMRRVCEETPPSPRSWNREVSPALAGVVMKAIAKQPSDRYATAREFADDLHRAIAGEPVTAAPETGGRRLARGARDLVRRLGLSGTGLILLMVSALGLLALAVRRGPDGAPPGWWFVMMMAAVSVCHATAWASFRHRSRFRTFDAFAALATAGLLGVVLMTSLAWDLGVRGLRLWEAERASVVAEVLLPLGFAVLAAGAWAAGRAGLAAVLAAAHVATVEWQVGWLGPERAGYYLVAALTITLAGLWRPVCDWLAGNVRNGTGWAVAHAVMIAAVAAGWVGWESQRTRVDYVAWTMAASRGSPAAPEAQRRMLLWGDDRLRHAEDRAVLMSQSGGVVPARSFEEILMKVRGPAYGWIPVPPILFDLAIAGAGEEDLLALAEAGGESVVRVWENLQRSDSPDHGLWGFHSQFQDANPWFEDDRHLARTEALDRLEPTDGFPASPDRLESRGPSAESRAWSLLACARAGTADTEALEAMLDDPAPLVRMGARRLLADAAPEMRADLLSGLLAEEHFDLFADTAYWALQALLADADLPDLEAWRNAHAPDGCRFAVDCARFSRGANEPAPRIAMFLRALRSGNLSYWDATFVIDAVCRRGEATMLAEAFHAGWPAETAQGLTRSQEGMILLDEVLGVLELQPRSEYRDRYRRRRLIERVSAERAAAAWTLGRPDEAAHYLSARVSIDDLGRMTQSVRYRIAVDQGDVEAAARAARRLMIRMGDGPMAPVPETCERYEEYRTAWEAASEF